MREVEKRGKERAGNKTIMEFVKSACATGRLVLKQQGYVAEEHLLQETNVL